MKDTKEIKNLSFTVMNDLDPNDTFEVEAANLQDAMFEALKELGWNIGEGKKIEDEPENN